MVEPCGTKREHGMMEPCGTKREHDSVEPCGTGENSNYLSDTYNPVFL